MARPNDRAVVRRDSTYVRQRCAATTHHAKLHRRTGRWLFTNEHLGACSPSERISKSGPARVGLRNVATQAWTRRRRKHRTRRRRERGAKQRVRRLIQAAMCRPVVRRARRLARPFDAARDCQLLRASAHRHNVHHRMPRIRACFVEIGISLNLYVGSHLRRSQVQPNVHAIDRSREIT